MDPLALHARTLDHARTAVRGVGPDHWYAPTPCDDWHVRDVVNHLVQDALWVPYIMEGWSVDEVGDRFDGDVLGETPVATFDACEDAAHRYFSRPGALEEVVNLSFGDVRAEVYCVQRATDLLVHGWDVATATGQRYEVDDDVAQAAYDRNAPMITDEVRAAGIFGPEVAVPESAPPMQRLLGLLGRQP